MRAFGSHLGDFFRVRWIFENVCFTKVKPYFLRSGRVLDRLFFILCFWIDAFGVLFAVFWRCVGPQGPHGGPMGPMGLWLAGRGPKGPSRPGPSRPARGPWSPGGALRWRPLGRCGIQAMRFEALGVASFTCFPRAPRGEGAPEFQHIGTSAPRYDGTSDRRDVAREGGRFSAPPSSI